MRSTPHLSLSLAVDELKQPLHFRVRQLLRDRILNDFEDGQRFYTERELMDKMAISQPTVRRALNDLVNEGYLLPRPRQGFFVRHHAPARYVGLITSEIHGSSLENDGYATTCRKHGFLLETHLFAKGAEVDDIVASIHRKPSEERILMTGMTVELTLSLAARLKAKGYQYLLLGPRVPGFNGGSVSIDYEAESDLMIDHLTGLGHERILFMVNEPRRLLITSLRAGILQRKLEERGLRHARVVFCDTHNWDSSFDAAYRKAGEILAERPWPTAIVPLSGVGSWAVLRYAMTHGIDVPGQLTIASFDPMTNSELLPIPLTEIAHSGRERAAQAIEKLWADNTSLVDIKFAPRLIPRQSSGPPPAA